MRLLVAVVLTSCTSQSSSLTADGSREVDASDFNQSGSRIKVVALETADGARIVTGLHDSARNEPCAFVTAYDGATRCLPTDRLTAVTYYSDAACTLPALALPSCRTPPKYISTQPAMACSTVPDTGPKVYARGTETMSAYRFDSSGTTCISTGTTPDTTYYPLGAEVPASEFQEATAVVQQ